MRGPEHEDQLPHDVSSLSLAAVVTQEVSIAWACIFNM